MRWFTFPEILNPQPKAADVVHALLAWTDAADAASQSNQDMPPFARPDGNSIFLADEEWWLIELEQRKTPDAHNDFANDSIADDNLTANCDLNRKAESGKEVSSAVGSRDVGRMHKKKEIRKNITIII